MSWLHNRQSKLIDSENAATSAAGPDANRPDRETTAEGDGDAEGDGAGTGEGTPPAV